MKERLFKIGVSDWILEFEFGEIVKFETVIKDVVTSSSDGPTNIVLMDVCFNSSFAKLFENKNKLKYLRQNFNLVNSGGEFLEELEYEYLKPEIKELTISGELDGVATMSVSFVCV